jgi:hypothetical protein
MTRFAFDAAINTAAACFSFVPGCRHFGARVNSQLLGQ